MSHGAYAAYSKSVASGATSTSAIDLQKAWNNVYLAIQSMTSNSQLHIQASDSETGTFRRVTHPLINSSTVALNTLTILSSVTSAIVPLPTGLRFMKIEQTATADSGQAYTILCGD